MRRSLGALVVSLALACASSAAGPGPATSPTDSGLRVLFLGNSLTYVHDVPALVSRLAMAGGRVAPRVTVRAEPNLGLEDHWNNPATRELVRTGDFDYVVMQQGPSTAPASRIDLLQWARLWSDETRRNGARPAVYAVWPPRGGDIDAGITNYTDAATQNNAVLFPVAHAWRETWIADPSMPLQGADGFHQAEHGAWLAAVVITAVLFDLPPSVFPNLFPTRITSTQESVMRNAAARAVASMRR